MTKTDQASNRRYEKGALRALEDASTAHDQGLSRLLTNRALTFALLRAADSLDAHHGLRDRLASIRAERIDAEFGDRQGGTGHVVSSDSSVGPAAFDGALAESPSGDGGGAPEGMAGPRRDDLELSLSSGAPSYDYREVVTKQGSGFDTYATEIAEWSGRTTAPSLPAPPAVVGLRVVCDQDSRVVSVESWPNEATEVLRRPDGTISAIHHARASEDVASKFQKLVKDGGTELTGSDHVGGELGLDDGREGPAGSLSVALRNGVDLAEQLLELLHGLGHEASSRVGAGAVTPASASTVEGPSDTAGGVVSSPSSAVSDTGTSLLGVRMALVEGFREVISASRALDRLAVARPPDPAAIERSEGAFWALVEGIADDAFRAKVARHDAREARS